VAGLDPAIHLSAVPSLEFGDGWLGGR